MSFVFGQQKDRKGCVGSAENQIARVNKRSLNVEEEPAILRTLLWAPTFPNGNTLGRPIVHNLANLSKGTKAETSLLWLGK